MTFTYLLWALVLLLLFLLIFRRLRQFKELTGKTDEENQAATITLTDQNFALYISDGITLVDFWAPWCGPCRVVGPIVGELAQKYKGKAKVGKLNVDENRITAAKYGIRSIPTLMLFMDGKPVEQVVGVRPFQATEKLLLKHLKSRSEA